MSETQGDRPDEFAASTSSDDGSAASVTPQSSDGSHGSDAGAPVEGAPVQDAPAQPAAGQPTASGSAPGEPSPDAPAQSAPAAPPAPPAYTGAPPSGTGYTAQGYDAPRAPQQPQPYSGASAPRSPQAPQQGTYAYPTGAAFGAAPQGTHPTQPTQPLHPTQAYAGSVTTDTAAPAKKRSGAGAVVGLIVAAALVGGAAGLGGAYAGVNMWSTSASAPASGPGTVTVNNTDSVTATTAIAAKVTPSVVTIEVSGGTSGGTGSGVVLTADGYIATNTHVVTLDGATSDPTIRVTTSDGKVYSATLVGTDPTYDLAVIKLEDASNLTPITFGDSSKINVGDQSVAIGAPLGLSNTVTTGIVSALNRSIEIASSAAPESGDSSGDSGDSGESNGQNGPFFFDNGQGTQQQSATETIKIAVIQTDAAINPGNSGGALVNGDGELIGINVAIATAGGTTSSSQSGSIGVGFSIPSDIVKRVTTEIIDNGSATHGLLGAGVRDAASVDGSTISGAYISEVVDGGAAAGGGLQVGDTVTEFNGVPVTDATDLTAQVRAAAAGSQASVTYVRDGKTATADVTLGTLGQ
ncbi:trypsin-like peptidase domain-containing protein [Microbacterium sp. P02]|uniref:trypsin-like peptidase domain-containing protein n=1 Tax=Microbacterium sp. P02 TaxID=3366260 RepID=UPI003671FE5C